MSSNAKGWVAAVLVAAVLTSACVGWALYRRQRTILVEINGIKAHYYTQEGSTQGIVDALGISNAQVAWSDLPSRQALSQGEPLRVHVARPLFVPVDGAVETLYVGSESVGEGLAAVGVELAPGDLLYLAGQPWDRDRPLPSPELGRRAEPREILAAMSEPLQVEIKRSTTIEVVENDNTLRFASGAATLGHALTEAGIGLYEADQASAETMIRPDKSVAIAVTRSLPVALEIGQEKRLARTCAGTIEDLLDQERVVLNELDYVRPSLNAAPSPNALVQVVRVLIERYVEEIPVAFEERWEPDPSIEIDQREIKHWGREGAERRLWAVRYENDQEVDRVSEEHWTAREPIDRVIQYGTNIVIRELDTPEGTIEYWRKVRMLATSYNAPTAGKPMDHPTYGITRMGLRARKGIIAVDPRVIPLGQDLFVPDYGLGMAGDTGGAILWRRIDLCFDDDNLELWKRWVDVYFLTPVPDESEITWMITNWPRERD